jgi:3-phenylpropionate/trans-cinnamate dioxygenase ferredoxin reductase subunit
VGEEAHQPYDRPPLSKQVLEGRWDVDRLPLRQEEGTGIDYLLGTRASALDVPNRRLTLDTGEVLPFDGLVIATGAAPRMIPGTPPLEGLHTLRTLEDCVALCRAFDAGPRVVVIGAGFIGAEVASSARYRGLEVTVLEALPVALGRVLGPDIGARCGQLHLDHGADLRLGVGVSGFRGTRRVEAVALVDGTVVDADLVVVGVGVAPVTGWLKGSGLTIDNGVVCDSRCRALGGEGAIVAAGDVARWEHPRFGNIRVEHWTNAVEQAQAAAATLLRGDEAPEFEPVPYFWSDQYETKIQYVGHAGPDDEVRVMEGDPDDGKFVAAYGRAGRTMAALSFSRPARIMAYRAAIAKGVAFPPEL